VNSSRAKIQAEYNKIPVIRFEDQKFKSIIEDRIRRPCMSAAG